MKSVDSLCQEILDPPLQSMSQGTLFKVRRRWMSKHLNIIFRILIFSIVKKKYQFYGIKGSSNS